MPSYRLLTSLYFASADDQDDWQPENELDQPRRFDAVVDTGARLTTLPYAVWQPFTDEIHLLEVKQSQRTIYVKGNTYSYRLGRVLLAAVDNNDRWLPPARTIVCCLDYHPDPPPALLGLTSPFLSNNRRLRH